MGRAFGSCATQLKLIIMNKTVTCNISGIIFNMEENAYHVLSTYLTDLKSHLRNAEGGEEIYDDIEIRIAELFAQKLSSSKQVITESDTDEVIVILGKPEDYIEEESIDFTEKSNESNEFKESSEKVFMRDPDNGMIAGVCTGISAYFGIDLTVVRALFVLLFFVTGFGLGLYIILWIIAPKAQSSADKLRMRGRPITVDSIKKEVQEAAERVERYSKSKQAKQKFENVKDRTNRFGRMLASLLGLFMIVGATFGIIAFLTVSMTQIGIFSSDDGERLISLYEFSDVIFSTSTQGFFGWSGLLGTVLIPLLSILIVGVILMLNIRSHWSKYIFVFLTIFWFISIGFLSIAGFQIAREFTVSAESEEIIGEVSDNTLYINIPDIFSENANVKIKIDDQEFGDLLQIENDNIKSGYVGLKFEASTDSLFHIRTEKSAYGMTMRKAMELQENIEHDIVLDSNELLIHPYYVYPKEDKLRGQHVEVYIAVPEGGKIEWKGNKKLLNISKRSRKIEFETKIVEIDID